MLMSLKKPACAAVVIAAALFAPVVSTGIANAQTVTEVVDPVILLSEVHIERTEKDAAGKEASVLHDPKEVVIVPGDKVIFTLSVVNSGVVPAAGFHATNPIPASVTFVSVDESWAEVSVDDGTIWGKLGTLTVNSPTEASGGDVSVQRNATAQDVTHVRWVFADAIASPSKTTVRYRGVVK